MQIRVSFCFFDFIRAEWYFKCILYKRGVGMIEILSAIVAFIMMIPSYYFSFLPKNFEENFEVIGSGLVKVSCRFVDFSGYDDAYTTQEMPAFYCIEPFNRFVYYSGDKPWTGDEKLSYENKLIFWPDAGYPHFSSTENWSAFIGEFDDSFGIGLYVPNEASFLAGVFDRENTTEKDPSVDDSTSYIAAIEWHDFKSFSPMEYEYYISTGTADEMRSSFEAIRN